MCGVPDELEKRSVMLSRPFNGRLIIQEHCGFISKATTPTTWHNLIVLCAFFFSGIKQWVIYME